MVYLEDHGVKEESSLSDKRERFYSPNNYPENWFYPQKDVKEAVKTLKDFVPIIREPSQYAEGCNDTRNIFLKAIDKIFGRKLNGRDNCKHKYIGTDDAGRAECLFCGDRIDLKEKLI